MGLPPYSILLGDNVLAVASRRLLSAVVDGKPYGFFVAGYEGVWVSRGVPADAKRRIGEEAGRATVVEVDAGRLAKAIDALAKAAALYAMVNFGRGSCRIEDGVGYVLKCLGDCLVDFYDTRVACSYDAALDMLTWLVDKLASGKLNPETVENLLKKIAGKEWSIRIDVGPFTIQTVGESGKSTVVPVLEFAKGREGMRKEAKHANPRLNPPVLIVFKGLESSGLKVRYHANVVHGDELRAFIEELARLPEEVERLAPNLERLLVAAKLAT